MATSSIYNNVSIKDKTLCKRFITALEHAEGKQSISVQMSKRVEDVKKDQVKNFFKEK